MNGKKRCQGSTASRSYGEWKSDESGRESSPPSMQPPGTRLSALHVWRQVARHTLEEEGGETLGNADPAFAG